MAHQVAQHEGPLLSVVAPCYNEEAVLPDFVRRMTAACHAAVADRFEIVLVNDGSRDRTWACIKTLASVNSQIVGLNLSRNHGHQLAVTAGLSYARGTRILVIDADLQDPPELLSEMMDRMNEGHDVVYAKRRHRPAESKFKLLTAHLYYRALRHLTEVPIPADTGDFRLISRRVVDRLNDMPEQDRFLRGMVAWLGGSQAEILYDREPRFAGTTGYTFLKMLRLAATGITSFSTFPLRIANVMAVGGIAAATVVGGYSVLRYLQNQVVPGWTSLAVIVVLFSSIQLVCLGILGSYVGRIFMQVKGRPLFIVDEVLSGGTATAHNLNESAQLVQGKEVAQAFR